MVDFFFWLMPLLPSESQRPDEQLSLVWTMAYALVAAFAFGFFNDDVVGRWYPELNAGAQVPRPRESVRRPLALFLYVFVGLYFFSALAFLSRNGTRGVHVRGRGREPSPACPADAPSHCVVFGAEPALCFHGEGL